MKRANVVGYLGCVAALLSVSSRAGGLDAGFFTTYSLFQGSQHLEFLTCGSSPTDEGCYGAGSLGPFGRVGCFIEGIANTAGRDVTRAVYVVDVSSGTGGGGVTLYRYLKTDTINSVTGDDTVSFKLTHVGALPLTGGPHASCFIAGNNGFLYVGTDQTSSVVQVVKGALSAQVIMPASDGYKIKYITSDQHGFVSVGAVGATSPDEFFTVFTPAGRLSEDGGGAGIILTPYIGYSNPPTAP